MSRQSLYVTKYSVISRPCNSHAKYFALAMKNVLTSFHTHAIVLMSDAHPSKTSGQGFPVPQTPNQLDNELTELFNLTRALQQSELTKIGDVIVEKAVATLRRVINRLSFINLAVQ